MFFFDTHYSVCAWVFLQSFDHGYYLLVKSIQELREKKEGLVTVGIGGPSGSGKTRYSTATYCAYASYFLFFYSAESEYRLNICQIIFLF